MRSSLRDYLRRTHPASLVFASCTVLVIGISVGGYLVLRWPDFAAPRAPTLLAIEQIDLAKQVSALQEYLRQVPNSGEEIDLAAHISVLDERLRKNPNSGEDWERIGRFYFESRRYDDAARAFGNAMGLLGETAERLANIGEAMTQADGGIISQEAHALFVRASQLDPALVLARFYLALALEQDGALNKAAKAWQALLEGAPAQAFWRPVVEQRLAAVTTRLGGDAPGTTGEYGGSDGTVPTSQKPATIEQMVSGLAERLNADGDDIDGWMMLMRSYTVLGLTEQAREALARARDHFGGDAAALSRIEQAADSLGLRD